jgi:hypothetical protein
MWKPWRKKKTNEKPKTLSKGLFQSLLFLLVGLIGALAIYFWFHEITLAFVFLASAICLAVFLSLESQRKEEKRDEGLEEEFVGLFTYFAIYLEDGLTVYGALQELLKFSSPEMDRRLTTLIRGIDKDKTVTPFVTFSSSFKNLAIKEVMIAAYKMVEEGGNGSFMRQYSAIFDALSAEKRKMKKERHLRALGNLAFLPLLASGLTSALITIGIMAVLRGVDGYGF